MLTLGIASADGFCAAILVPRRPHRPCDVVRSLRQESGPFCREHIPTRNLHFLMGTMASHMRTFIVIGLLRFGLDPAELAKQSDLFK